MSTQKITFPGHSGADLAARLDLPREHMQGMAIFAHCFTCSKEIAAAVRVSRALATKQIATLRFDFSGIGRSGGEFGAFGEKRRP